MPATKATAAFCSSACRARHWRLMRRARTRTQDTLGITIKVVPRPKDARGLVVLPKRWVVSAYK
ncbi:hypothetical protein ACWC0C_43145 [Streptomyces sp. NPDC001709]